MRQQGNGSSAVTMKAIAMEAGVSVPAVSKVLHGRGTSIRVSEERATIIREVAKRLKYTPNALARSLRTSRSHSVGLVFEHFGNIAGGPQYYVGLLDGIASELFKHHYRLTIMPEVPHHQLGSVVNDGRLDGLIWCKLPNDLDLLDELEACSIPVVALNSPAMGGAELCFVSCDNEAGKRLAVEHLFQLGHRRILFAMEHGETETPDATARLAGMRAAMAEFELEFGEEDLVCWDLKAAEFGAWWACGPPQSAIIAWNEGLAGGIIERAREAAVLVPAELSVIGFDSTAYCESTLPRLTAVRQPIREMAQEATRILLDLIFGKPLQARSRRFDCTLDVRGSTAEVTR